jgi:hypothetical protein
VPGSVGKREFDGPGERGRFLLGEVKEAAALEDALGVEDGAADGDGEGRHGRSSSAILRRTSRLRRSG